MSDTVEIKQGLIDAVEGKGDEPDKNTEEKPIFTQKQLDAKIAERLTREKNKQDEAVNKAKKEAEEKALADNAEWKTLAEKREQELSALSPFKDKAERYEKALTAQLEKAREGLPKAVLTLLDRLDPAEQLEYIAENREELFPEKEDKPEKPEWNLGKLPMGSKGKEGQDKRTEGMVRFWKGS